jgi:hypothetical protein
MRPPAFGARSGQRRPRVLTFGETGSPRRLRRRPGWSLCPGGCSEAMSCCLPLAQWRLAGVKSDQHRSHSLPLWGGFGRSHQEHNHLDLRRAKSHGFAPGKEITTSSRCQMPDARCPGAKAFAAQFLFISRPDFPSQSPHPFIRDDDPAFEAIPSSRRRLSGFGNTARPRRR